MSQPSPTGGAVQPGDWLLALLALRDAQRPLDPVRLQKSLFLLREEGGLSPAEAYRFEPYDYGPFSGTIYRDLGELLDGGLAKEQPVEGYNWSRYLITAAGMHRARALVERFDRSHQAVLIQLAAIKNELLDLPFDALLRRVYDSHPDYARNSVFR
jgi:hypothetical protein